MISRRHLLILFSLLMPTNVHAGSIGIRGSSVGYAPNDPKEIVITSDSDLSGKAWRIMSKDGAMVLSGSFAASAENDSKTFRQVLSFTAMQTPGDYALLVPGADAVTLTINAIGHAMLAAQVFDYSRFDQGTSTRADAPSAIALFDGAAAVVHATTDDGMTVWTMRTPTTTVDVQGGFFDVGEYTKYTLSNAFTTYTLLRTYLANPTLVGVAKGASGNQLVGILQEAKLGLDYLSKTYPVNGGNEFIVQVSTATQGKVRKNAVRSTRQAYSALSRVHMGMTAATLALGARVFGSVPGYASQATLYREKSIAIYARASAQDAIDYVDERSGEQTFYKSATATENMDLAAIELYRVTGDKHYLGAEDAPMAQAETETETGTSDVPAMSSAAEERIKALAISTQLDEDAMQSEAPVDATPVASAPVQTVAPASVSASAPAPVAIFASTMPAPVVAPVSEVPTPAACMQTTCEANSWACGTHSDACGGLLSCGGCDPGSACNTRGHCEAVCVPTTCDSAGWLCGKHADGCGGMVWCGACGQTQAKADHPRSHQRGRRLVRR